MHTRYKTGLSGINPGRKVQSEVVETERAFPEVECHPNMKDGFIFVVPYSVEFSAEPSEMTPGPRELSATLKSMLSVKNFTLNKMTSVFVPGSAAGRWF